MIALAPGRLQSDHWFMLLRKVWIGFGLWLVLGGGLFRAAYAADVPADPSNYRMLIGSLAPGDRLLLAPGEYAEGLPLSDLNGQPGMPIIIEGPAMPPRAVVLGRSCCNTISLRNVSYVEIKHLDVDVRGELVDGVKAEGDAQFAHNITLEDLYIHSLGNDQQIVGINTKCPAWDWVIRNNVIEDAGTGLYLGNSDGNQPFIRGLIEHNLVVDPIGYAMQIKHQNPRPQVNGIPTQTSQTIIRHNVFIKAQGASQGGNARPNLLVGHWPASGPGQNDSYEIYGNFLFQNQSGTEGLFQGEGRINFHDNLLVNTFGPGLYIQPQNDAVKEVNIYHNTVYAQGEGIAIFGGQGFVQQVVANAVFAGSPLSGGQAQENVTDSLGNAGNYVNNASNVLGSLDFFPIAGTLNLGAVDLSAFAGQVDADRDFNGQIRGGAYRGAYGAGGENPGWEPQVGVKTLVMGPPPPPPPLDGGVGVDLGRIGDLGAGVDGGVVEADAGEVVEHTTGGCSAHGGSGGVGWLLVFGGIWLFWGLLRGSFDGVLRRF